MCAFRWAVAMTATLGINKIVSCVVKTIPKFYFKKLRAVSFAKR